MNAFNERPLEKYRCVTGDRKIRAGNRTAMGNAAGSTIQGIITARNMGETIHHNDRMNRWKATGHAPPTTKFSGAFPGKYYHERLLGD
jgi:hypothetical protein